LYGAARIGDLIVTSNYSPTASGWAIVLLGVAVLALGGCGRKSTLDLPPTASPQAAAAAQANADHEPAESSKPSVFNPYYGTDAPPAAAKGNKRPFILDPLLGN
jgi:predicted small lipoprotein YifL